MLYKKDVFTYTYNQAQKCFCGHVHQESFRSGKLYIQDLNGNGNMFLVFILHLLCHQNFLIMCIYNISQMSMGFILAVGSEDHFEGRFFVVYY